MLKKPKETTEEVTLRVAPTSMNILDEFELNSEEKEQLDKLYKDLGGNFDEGKVVTGTIIAKDGTGLLVDINYKSNGLIGNHEFSEFELKRLMLHDKIEVLLDKLEDEHGAVMLSYQKAKSIKAWDKISEYAQSDEPVRGVVTHKVKGGLSVDIGIPAFLPGSQVDIQRVANFDHFVGKEVICKILKVNRKRGNVIISRRRYLEEQRSEDKKRVLDTITEGQVLQGIVKNITNYGAFIDVGGVDGLLHITDMSWGRITHPSELVRIGDTITVKIISFDKNNEKISLGMKQLMPNPWDGIEQRYPLGSRIKGKVSSVTEYGLFVEIEKGIEGLVHISEISWTERITNLSRHYAVGTIIDVVVVSIDKDNRRMSLSIKQLSEDPWKMVAERFHIGDRITGHVTNVTDFGIFIQLHDGVDGLVHVSDISWTEHITHPGDRYKRSDVVQAVILSIDLDSKKISLGIKQLTQDPWDGIEGEFQVGKLVEGTVSKVTNFGAFVRLTNGIEGLVHISELSEKEITKSEDVVKVGQVEKFRVIKLNREERKLGLSLRAAKAPYNPVEQPKPVQSEASPEREAREKSPAQRKFTQRKQEGAPVHRERGPRSHKETVTTTSTSGSLMKGSLQQALQGFKEQQMSENTPVQNQESNSTDSSSTPEE
jgi:small subunit ribosomal protein S1